MLTDEQFWAAYDKMTFPEQLEAVQERLKLDLPLPERAHLEAVLAELEEIKGRSW